MSNEPAVIINGQTLTEAQAMTVRVALQSFANNLAEDGLGDDDHGEKMVELYLRNISDVNDIILKGESE